MKKTFTAENMNCIKINVGVEAKLFLSQSSNDKIVINCEYESDSISFNENIRDGIFKLKIYDTKKRINTIDTNLFSGIIDSLLTGRSIYDDRIKSEEKVRVYISLPANMEKVTFNLNLTKLEITNVSIHKLRISGNNSLLIIDEESEIADSEINLNNSKGFLCLKQTTEKLIANINNSKININKETSYAGGIKITGLFVRIKGLHKNIKESARAIINGTNSKVSIIENKS